MDTGINLSMAAELVVVLHEFSACLFVETALREWHNEKAFDDSKDVLQRPAAGVPVLFQSVYTNLSRRNCNIGMEYFSQEVTYIWN